MKKTFLSGNNGQGEQASLDPFITFIEEPHYVDGTTTDKATLEFGLLFGRNKLSNRTIRVMNKYRSTILFKGSRNL
ncbi:hypothetical protein R4Z10_19330 [Niallia sp. XMNu-256]|uniref:hypothetical protein n=1 Tax=Niallia sp. XMNu-256 TaxID=3082444 RepID=UPI0030D0A172